jgi:hypothetical protein
MSRPCDPPVTLNVGSAINRINTWFSEPMKKGAFPTELVVVVRFDDSGRVATHDIADYLITIEPSMSVHGLAAVPVPVVARTQRPGTRIVGTPERPVGS